MDNNQKSAQELEREALLERARKYVAEQQSKNTTETAAPASVATESKPSVEERFTTRQERMAEVMPRAQEYVKNAMAKSAAPATPMASAEKVNPVIEHDPSVINAAKIMGVDVSQIRPAGENPVEYPYEGFEHPKDLGPGKGANYYSMEFNAAIVGYMEKNMTPTIDPKVEAANSNAPEQPTVTPQVETTNAKSPELKTPEIITKTVEKVSDTATKVKDVVADKASEYQANPSNIGKDIGEGVNSLLTSFGKGLSIIGNNITSLTENPPEIGAAVQNGVKKVGEVAGETVEAGKSFFSLDSLKSGLGKVDSFLKEQETKNQEAQAKRQNSNNMQP